MVRYFGTIFPKKFRVRPGPTHQLPQSTRIFGFFLLCIAPNAASKDNFKVALPGY